MKITTQEILEYRFNFTIHVLKYALAVSLTGLVWLAVLAETDVPGLTPESTIRYFFFAAMIYSLSNFHTWYIDEDIKQGRLSKYFVKPISYFRRCFANQLTYTLVETVIKLIIMIPLLNILGFGFSPSLTQILIFISYMPLIYIFTFLVQFTIASIAFWLKEAYSLRWMSLSISRFLSGIVIPLHLLPAKFLKNTFLLPFQHLAYTPIQAIQGEITSQYALQGIMVLLFWIIIAWIVKEKVWHKGTHSYEAVGI